MCVTDYADERNIAMRAIRQGIADSHHQSARLRRADCLAVLGVDLRGQAVALQPTKKHDVWWTSETVSKKHLTP